jgi:hypothetical protein
LRAWKPARVTKWNCAHRSELSLEGGDLGVGELAFPVEARGAVVGEHLVGELRAHAFGEALGFDEVGGLGLAPDEVGGGRVSDAARDRHLDPVGDGEEAFGGAVAGAEALVARVDVAREELRALGVGARDEQLRHVAHVGR